VIYQQPVRQGLERGTAPFVEPPVFPEKELTNRASGCKRAQVASLFRTVEGIAGARQRLTDYARLEPQSAVRCIGSGRDDLRMRISKERSRKL